MSTKQIRSIRQLYICRPNELRKTNELSCRLSDISGPQLQAADAAEARLKFFSRLQPLAAFVSRAALFSRIQPCSVV